MAAPRKLALHRETLINLHADLDAVLGGTNASGDGRQATVGGGLTSKTEPACGGTFTMAATCTLVKCSTHP